MSGRTALALVLSLGVGLSACASGGASNGADPAPTRTNTDAVEREYAPGTAPSSNRSTRSAEVYLEQARNADNQEEAAGDYRMALERAQESIGLEPNNPLGYYQAGVAHLGLGNLQQAGEMLDRAEEIYPRYAEDTRVLRQRAWATNYNEAIAAIQQGNQELAIQKMEAADAIYAGAPEARVNLGIIYTNRGEFERALDYYEGALEILQGPEVQYLTPERRADWAEQEGVVLFNMAEVLRRLDRGDEALELYRTYLSDNPGDATAQVQLGMLLLDVQGDAPQAQAEAQRLFESALENPDLDPEDYSRIGIGLFNAGRFDAAARAFERAVAANPYFREAVFNLSQSLLAHANELEDTAPEEYIATNERLVAVAEQLLELDPFYRTGYATLATGYRALADATEGATSQRWRDELVSVLQRYEALPFNVSDVTLTSTGAGSIALTGQLENINVAAGTPIRLQFSLIDPSGTAVATREVSVPAPAAGQTTSFDAQFQVEGEIAGWRYSRL